MHGLDIGERRQHHQHLGGFEYPRVVLHVAVVHLDIGLGEEAEDLRQQVPLGRRSGCGASPSRRRPAALPRAASERAAGSARPHRPRDSGTACRPDSRSAGRTGPDVRRPRAVMPSMLRLLAERLTTTSWGPCHPSIQDTKLIRGPWHRAPKGRRRLAAGRQRLRRRIPGGSQVMNIGIDRTQIRLAHRTHVEPRHWRPRLHGGDILDPLSGVSFCTSRRSFVG